VGRREPGSFNVIFLPEFKEAVDANCSAEDAAGDIGGVCGFAVLCVDPMRIISWMLEAE